MRSLDVILVVALVVSAMGTVMAARLLWSAIGLAITSAILSMIMFRFDASLAGVFELSVCAGLIPAIFISAISLTRRLTPDDLEERRRQKRRRYGVLPILVILAAVALSQVHLALNFASPPPPAETNVRNVLWNLRTIDLVGQIVVLLGGAFGVVALLKELKRDH
jgi:NADH:ubiquinone oxidoreductase subunit 6 (subunit J)